MWQLIFVPIYTNWSCTLNTRPRAYSFGQMVSAPDFKPKSLAGAFVPCYTKDTKSRKILKRLKWLKTLHSFLLLSHMLYCGAWWLRWWSSSVRSASQWSCSSAPTPPLGGSTGQTKDGQNCPSFLGIQYSGLKLGAVPLHMYADIRSICWGW